MDQDEAGRGSNCTGKSGDELLAILRARLNNDPETERRVVRDELGKINRIRLERMLGEGVSP